MANGGSLGADASSDDLRIDDLRPAGGSWGGLLFDNPTIGLESNFYWSFDFQFGRIQRDFGSVDPSITIDWVTGGPRSWRTMRGFQFDRFAWSGFEASLYFFEHYRYEAVRLAVGEQDGTRLRVTSQLSGDIDGLGLDEVRTDDWLDLSDIRVSVSDAHSTSDAVASLGRYLETEGLEGELVMPGVFRFVPAG